MGVFVIMAAMGFFGFIFGVVYPVFAVVIYKICGSKKSIRQILKEI